MTSQTSNSKKIAAFGMTTDEIVEMTFNKAKELTAVQMSAGVEVKEAATRAVAAVSATLVKMGLTEYQVSPLAELLARRVANLY